MPTKRAGKKAYIGLCDGCSKVCAVTSILPDLKKDNANFVRSMVRQGLEVNIVTLEETRDIEWCDCRKKAKAQGTLFEGVEVKKPEEMHIFVFVQTWEVGVLARNHEEAEKALSEGFLFTEDRDCMGRHEKNFSDDYCVFKLNEKPEVEGLYTTDGEYHEGDKEINALLEGAINGDGLSQIK